MRRSTWVLLAVVTAIALVPALGQAAPDWATPPPDISADGHRVDSLFYATTVMLLVLFCILTFVLLVSATRHRSASRHEVHFHRGHATRDLLLAGGISATIFFVVDGNLLYNSYHDLREVFWNYPADSPQITRVQIMPQQWAWRFRLPGEDGKFNTPDDIVTLNDLRVPVGKRVLAQLMSRDVIHSFFLPNVRQKQDANPGAVTRMTFLPVKTGTYEVVCAEMCGLNHYKMRAEMTVMSEEDYARWLDEATVWAKAGYDPDDEDAHWGWDWATRGKS
jgi:cytochrome c oxidase subunit 2